MSRPVLIMICILAAIAAGLLAVLAVRRFKGKPGKAVASKYGAAGQSKAEMIAAYEAEIAAPLQQALDILRKRQLQEAERANASQHDFDMRRSFWRRGGIRFYCEQLLRRLKEISPDADIESMRVDLYNSLICPIQQELAALKQKRGAASQPEENGALLDMIELKRVDAELDTEILRQNMQDNRSAIQAVLALPAEPAYHGGALMQELSAIFESADACILRPHAGDGAAPSRKACFDAMQRLIPQLEALLDRYSVPV